jgi:hypothetical protein
MRNQTIPTGTVKMKYIEAFVNANGLRKQIAFFENEKAEARKAGDEGREFDAMLEVKDLNKELALAELNMMYFADILKLREETL